MLMTGPARCAWVIGALLFACLPLHARAATPRDAVKLLPTISHTSTFEHSESDLDSGHSFQDNYNGRWEVRWSPPPIALGDKANAFLDFNYDLALKDNLNRIAESSDDGRGDHYNIRTRLEAPYLGVSHEWDQSDSWSGMYDKVHLPRWYSSRVTRSNLNWTPPGLPTLRLAHSNNYTYPQAGRTPGTESEYLAAVLEYQPQYPQDVSRFGQRYAVTSEFTRSRNYATGTSARSNKTTFDGFRELHLGNVGSLVASYRYFEESKAGQGTVAPDSDRSLYYGLTLDGGVAQLPLGYNLTYGNTTAGNSAGNGFSQAQRRLKLDFSPPVPKGKSAGMSYLHEVVDFENEPNANGVDTNETQQLSWSFKVNPRTSGGVQYRVTNRTDVLRQQRTSDTDLVVTNLNYEIPGRRGTLSGSYSQAVERSPLYDSQSNTTVLDLQSRFSLGQRASMRLFMNQLYSDNSSAALLAPTGTDKLLTGFTYSIDYDYGLHLDTTWKQDFSRNTLNGQHTGTGTNVASLNVNLRFQPPNTAWFYQLSLNSHDDSRTSIDIPANNSYETSNWIQATVSYTF